MVHAHFVRSPVPHATITDIDISGALSAGALTVLTADNVPTRKLISRYWNSAIRGGQPHLLATERVRYVGEPVALVVAGDGSRAEDIAPLVRIEYEPLDALASPRDALRPGAVRLHEEWTGNIAAELRHTLGDADTAMRQCSGKLTRSFHFGRQTGLPLETRGCVADFDRRQNRLTAWVSTQTHYAVRNNMAEILGIPEFNVRVIAEDVGGGFGSKSRPYAEEVLVALASRQLDRPVKWIEDRVESLRATTHSRSISSTIEIGHDENGCILAIRGELVVDVGAYVFTSGILTAEVAGGQAAGPYRIPNIDLHILCIGTNKTPLATHRGAGQPEATLALECLLDLVAAETSLSAHEIRLRNIVRPDDMPFTPSIPYAGPRARFESGDFPAMVKRAVVNSGYHETVETLESGEQAAWGLACGLEATGFVGIETARIRVNPDSRVTVWSGMSSQGQGQSSAYARVCSDILGLTPDRVTVLMGDTEMLSLGRGAFASRGAVVGANAVAGAARTLHTEILRGAGSLMQCQTTELETRDGHVVRRDGSGTGLSFGDIARATMPGGPLYSGTPALEAEHVNDSPDTLTFALSVHVARVALDRELGACRVVDYFVLHDSGRMLDEMIVEGQVRGGVVEGIGCTLLSEILHSETAQPLSATLADYLVMGPVETPPLRLDHVCTIPTTNPLGVRGVGEGGVIPAPPAIVNALRRIAAPGSMEAEAHLYRLPVRPEAILSSMNVDGRRPA